MFHLIFSSLDNIVSVMQTWLYVDVVQPLLYRFNLMDYDEDTLTNVGDITGLLPGPDDMELSADKRYLWVTFRFAKHVGIIDLNTHKLIQTIAVGRSPHGIYFFDRAPVTAPNGA